MMLVAVYLEHQPGKSSPRSYLLPEWRDKDSTIGLRQFYCRRQATDKSKTFPSSVELRRKLCTKRMQEAAASVWQSSPYLSFMMTISSFIGFRQHDDCIKPKEMFPVNCLLFY
jgi:hypothetical protein